MIRPPPRSTRTDTLFPYATLFLSFCGILLAILPAAAPAHAEEIDWKAGKLGHLAPHIGTYRYDAVLGDPAVKATLEALVGADLAAVIATNLTAAGPNDFVGGHLVLRGIDPHPGGEEEALVIINNFDGPLRPHSLP